MTTARMLTRWLAPLMVAASLALPAVARATYEVTPLACDARPVPFVGGQLATFAVMGYDNHTATTQNIPLGSNNILSNPPIFRAGQPTSFLAGLHEASWTGLINNYALQPVSWYLDGATATSSDAVCGGGDVPQPDRLPTASPATAAVGDTLTLDPGTWDGSVPGGVELLLERCVGTACAIAPRALTMGPSYTVTSSDAGSQLRLVAVMLTAHGWSSVLSDPVAVAGSPGTPISVPSAPGGQLSAPVPMAEPTVSGDPIDGGELTADPGTWAGPVSATSIRWQRCDTTGCADVAGADGERYTPTSDDVGQRLRAVVTQTATGVATYVSGGTVHETAATAPTEAVAPAPPPSPTPSTSTPGSTDTGTGTGTGTGSSPAPGTPVPTLPAPPPRLPVPSLTIKGLRAAPASFRVGPHVTPLDGTRNPNGRATSLQLTLSVPAWIRIDIQRAGAHGRFLTIATLSRFLGAGHRTIRFTGRLPHAAGGALRPGRYRLAVGATDATGRRAVSSGVVVRIVR